jgi:hypothetical protein
MTTATTTTTSRAAVLAGLARFIAQRSGIDPRNYRTSWADKAGHAAFMDDYRKILRHGRDARTLLRAVELRGDITADDMAELSRGRRLELLPDGSAWHYTAGQYFAVEYRAAACGLLAAALWQKWRSDNAAATADDLRRNARREFGRAIAGRWFA